MKTNYRRFALLTGASAAAICISSLNAAPALAAPHDGLAAATTVAGTDTTSATVTICDIAGTSPCFYGVYNTGSGLVTAAVNGTASGRIYQHLTNSTVSLTLNNLAGSSAEVGGIAVATGAAAQTAHATVDTAIEQSANGTSGSAANNLNNDGTLIVDALALASSTGVGSAHASASLDVGVYQYANATGPGNQRGLEQFHQQWHIFCTSICDSGGRFRLRLCECDPV